MHNYTTVYPENSPSRIQFYTQKTKSSLSTTTYRGQRDLHSRFQKRNSTHRRQGDLLEIHPYVLQDIPGIPAARPSKGIQLLQTFQPFQAFQTFQSFQPFQTFQSFMTFQPFQAILQILQSSSISRESNPFQYSPIRMHILQILQFNWFPQKLHRIPVGQLQTFLQTLHSSKKGRCCDIG